jgi:hypothetical protein
MLPVPSAPAEIPRELYLDLLKRVLTRTGFENSYRLIRQGSGWRSRAYPILRRALDSQGLELVRWQDPSTRELGHDVPSDAETMVGRERLDNLQWAVQTVLSENVPGDLLEAGVWRGGSCILMRAVLQAYDCTDRTVWVADSFEGMPPTDPGRYPADAADVIGQWDKLAVSREQVQANFERYGLLDDQVKFLKGWFADTLPGAPVKQLALLRLDGDLYSSTMDILNGIYERVAAGGFVIVDDYNIPTCSQAITDYRDKHGITDEIVEIDGSGVYWRKSA